MDKRTYRLSWRTNAEGIKRQFAMLIVPSHIAHILWEQDIQEFTADLTEEGILYRPVTGPKPQVEIPTWLKVPPTP